MRRVSPARLVLAHTRPRGAPFVPEIRLHLADDSLAVWEATQVAVDHGELPPPFWAFAWAGGQALARHLLDHPQTVAGRPVVDIACGSGLVAIAAALAGAASVTAYDVDEIAVAAVRLNARLNGVDIDACVGDARDVAVPPGAVVTVGDGFYDRAIATVMSGALARLAACGAEVVVGDPYRDYLPVDRFDPLADYQVDVEADLEDAAVKRTLVGRLRQPAGR